MLIAAFLLALQSPPPATARPAPTAPARPFVVQRSDSSAVARLIHEGIENSHVEADLAYLTDVIGPRLTGSPGVDRANEWTAQKFREYGTDRAWLEPWTFGVGWNRGPMTLHMLLPQRRELLAVSWAWAPGTNGPLAGDVVFMDARTQQEFDRRFAGKLHGAWAMLGPASRLVDPDGPGLTHADSVRLDSLRRAAQPVTDDERRFLSTAARFTAVVNEGVAGIVRDGAKQFGLLTMSGSPAAISPVPQVVVANDTYAQFERLARRGERIRIEADIRNALGTVTLQQRNTIADIRGAEKPDEVVLLGAHLDSWDLATGATDNGTGAIAVLEAARILTASGVKPKRTIRFALFTGEEQGLLGSQAFAAAHAADLPRYQAVLVLDNGSGRITGMALQGRDDLAELWKSLFAPVAALGPFVVRSGNKGGTDHLSFIQDGVPSFNWDQLTRGYDHTHHSQIDTFDHTQPADVAQAATVMAVQALALANLDVLLPRGR